jgi:hypothetical protein
MAVEPEDDELLLDQQDEGQGADEERETEGQGSNEAGDEADKELEITFGDEAAPASAESDEGESSVIRELRERYREATRELSALRKTAPTPLLEDPGPEPVWEEDQERFEYDQDRWISHWRSWQTKKQTFEAAQRQQEEHTRTITAAYQAKRGELKIPGIEDAEKRVFEQVDDLTKNALIRAGNPALVAALDRYPQKLANLSSITDPVELLLAIGEMRGKLIMAPKRRAAPEPEEIASGNARVTQGSDKTLERLEKEAEKTGDRTKLIQYRARLRERGTK